MKSRNAVCVFCKHEAAGRLSLLGGQRWRSTAEPFVLPRVVIDLDAADNVNVKQFEGLSSEEKARHLNAYDDQKLVRRTVQNSFNKRRLNSGRRMYRFGPNDNIKTPAGLVSYALNGTSTPHLLTPPPEILVRDRQNSRYRPQDAVASRLQDIVNSFHIDNNLRLRRDGFNFSAEQVESLRKRISTCHTLYALRNIFSNFTGSREGCQLLAENEDAIADSIKLSRIRQATHPKSATSQQVLQLLNNLHISLQSKGIAFGPVLASRALYYAAKAGSLPAVELYFFKYAKGMDYSSTFLSRVPVEILDTFLEAEVREGQQALERQQRLADTLRLLTGWESGSASAEEERKDSIGKFLADGNWCISNNELYRRYVFTLAQLGLKSTLSAEWERIEGTLDSNLDKNLIKKECHYFALAFTLLGDSEKAMAILDRISRMSTKKRSSTSLTRLHRTFIHDHYKCLNLTAPPHLYTRLEEVIRSIPTEPEGALKVLRSFLITDYARGHTLRSVDIRDVEGQEILLVAPLKDGNPLYAKALFAADRSNESA